MDKPTKTVQLPTFDTVEQLMADKYLKKCLQKLIDEMNAERNSVSDNGKKKLKSSPVETLVGLDKFTPDFITSEYIEIHNKRSKYSHDVREFITFTINEVVGDTFKHYETLYQKQQRKTAKSKQS